MDRFGPAGRIAGEEGLRACQTGGGAGLQRQRLRHLVRQERERPAPLQELDRGGSARRCHRSGLHPTATRHAPDRDDPGRRTAADERIGKRDDAAGLAAETRVGALLAAPGTHA